MTARRMALMCREINKQINIVILDPLEQKLLATVADGRAEISAFLK